jgi:hypothetical protein
LPDLQIVGVDTVDGVAVEGGLSGQLGGLSGLINGIGIQGDNDLGGANLLVGVEVVSIAAGVTLGVKEEYIAIDGDLAGNQIACVTDVTGAILGVARCGAGDFNRFYLTIAVRRNT